MKTFYVCDVCGLTSEDQKAVATCERQPLCNPFHVGESVSIVGMTGNARAVITGIEFALGTHIPRYHVQCQDTITGRTEDIVLIQSEIAKT